MRLLSSAPRRRLQLTSNVRPPNSHSWRGMLARAPGCRCTEYEATPWPQIQMPRHRLQGHADPSSNTGQVAPCKVGALKELPLVNHPARKGQPFQVSWWSALRAGVLRRAVSSLGSPQAPSWPSDTAQRCALLGHGCSGSLGAVKNRGRLSGSFSKQCSGGSALRRCCAAAA